MRSVIARFGVGLALIPPLIAVAVLVTWRWGPLFGIWGWATTAAGLLFLAAMVLALLEEFFRTPNPYTRIHYLYDLRDVSPDRNLYASAPTMLWQIVPLVVVGVVLVVAGGW